MPLFTTLPVDRLRAEGEFHCPHCEGRRPFRRLRAQQYLMLFSFRLFPVNESYEYVVCQDCDLRWEPEAIDYDPQLHQAELRAEWERAILVAMIRVMLADGRTLEDEVDTLRDVYQRITERPLSEGELLAEMAMVEARREPLAEALRRFLPVLDEHGKEMAFRAALAVAAADGELQEEERLLLIEIADVLQMSEAHVRGIFDSSHPADEMRGEG